MNARLRPLATAATVALLGLASIASSTSLAHADAPATSPADSAVLAKIATARGQLHTLKVPFTQDRTIGLLATKVHSTGQLLLVMPDRLRWELFAPDSATYWVAPDGISYKSTNGQGQLPASEKKVSAGLQDLRVLLGGDLNQLGERYVLHTSETADETVLDATAKDPSHGLRGFTLAWAKSDLSVPKRATLLEAGKDRSDIVFGAAQKDAPIDAALMHP